MEAVFRYLEELDPEVIGLNQGALAQLHCDKQLVIIPGATHLFEESGALEEVAWLARAWFERYLTITEISSGAENPSG
jgi:putative phosphoribosyl transferase